MSRREQQILFCLALAPAAAMAPIALLAVSSSARAAESPSIRAAAPAAPNRLLYWYGEIGDGSRAIDALAGRGPWRIPRATWRAKATFVFAKPLRADRVEIESCDGSFKEGFDARFDFDRAAASAEAGKPSVSFPIPRSGEGLRSLTLVAQGAGGDCLSAIRFFDGASLAPARPPSEIEASLADWATPLFDLRPETAASLAMSVELAFSSPRKIDRVEIWNGDQASSTAFAARPRAKTLSIEGADGYRETLELKDELAPQMRVLSRPYSGRSLRIRAISSHAGRDGGAAAISEIRFFDGADDWRPAVDRALADRESALRAAFAAARLERALDRTLAADLDGDRWLARFRSDGSFFLRGFDDDVRSARSFVALGRFTVEPAKGRGLALKLRGFRRPSNVELDGDPCGQRCADRAAGSAFETPFMESVRLETLAGTALIRASDLAPRRSRALKFDRISFGLGDVAD